MENVVLTCVYYNGTCNGLYRELDIAYRFEKLILLVCKFLNVSYVELINNWFLNGAKNDR